MSLVKSGQLIDQKEVSKPTQKGTRLIDYMKSRQILWHLAYKHRVGLLITASIVGWGQAFHVDKFIGLII